MSASQSLSCVGTMMASSDSEMYKARRDLRLQALEVQCREQAVSCTSDDDFICSICGMGCQYELQVCCCAMLPTFSTVLRT